MKKQVIRIQPEEDNGTLPYPYFINEEGFVGRQDFWKGKPYKLIGFSPIPKQEFDKRQIDVSTFFESPKKAIGMYPIFADIKDNWYTYQLKIALVK